LSGGLYAIGFLNIYRVGIKKPDQVIGQNLSIIEV